MANEITRLLPFRQYDENDVINFYSLDGITGSAGTVVQVSSADLNSDPVTYVNRGDAYLNTLGDALSQFPAVPHKVSVVTGTGASVKPLGIMLRDVRNLDENGESLLYYNQKKEELQAVVSGEAVPIATKGLFTLNVNGLAGGVAPAINSLAVPSANGTLTGVPVATAVQAQKDAAVGKFIATGSRSGGFSQDVFSGSFAILKLEL
jgi:hypothetical protein